LRGCVVLIEDRRTLELLMAISDPLSVAPDGTPVMPSAHDERPSLRFGRLNVIVVKDAGEYLAWSQGTRELIARSPVTRDEARVHLVTLVDTMAPRSTKKTPDLIISYEDELTL